MIQTEKEGVNEEREGAKQASERREHSLCLKQTPETRPTD
jgi:hypothetical protein